MDSSPTCDRPSCVNADALNAQCLCLRLDTGTLESALDPELGTPRIAALVRERCPHLFAEQPVFVAAPLVERMAQVVRAVESVVALPAYPALALATAPPIAQMPPPGPQGVFFGYDFHLQGDRLGLIEINTNAGGALLNVALARAQRGQCAAVGPLQPDAAGVAAFEQAIVDMFRNEWQLAGRQHPLKTIAIVDQAPERQYLYPEFLLFERLFERHGLNAVVTDPAGLEWRAGLLWCGEQAIDLVYNRLTDFYLEAAESTALRTAFLEDAVVLTPHPHAHALYADKRRLALLSDEAALQALEVPADTRALLLANIPRTEVVEPADADRLWKSRRGLFFKPVHGYGSRAAYRGDKLTQRVWQDILAGSYVAQAIVAPGVRRVDAQSEAGALKFDLRAYVYQGRTQWLAARLYQGQTTNFRTAGGGFAPVYSTVGTAHTGSACTVRPLQVRKPDDKIDPGG